MVEPRVVRIGTQKYTKVICNDKPGHGNACHSYTVETVPQNTTEPVAIVSQINFQNGPIKEAGVNGCHNEDLLAIVIDRLQGFQSGAYACRENAIALTKIEEALHWLAHRTHERIERGVEGTHTI
jgi:hypothetical protein